MSDSTTMLIGLYRSAKAVAAPLAIIATQNCPTCNGKASIFLVGEEVPCPGCREEEYRDAMLRLGIDPALEEVGNGMGLR